MIVPKQTYSLRKMLTMAVPHQRRNLRQIRIRLIARAIIVLAHNDKFPVLPIVIRSLTVMCQPFARRNFHVGKSGQEGGLLRAASIDPKRNFPFALQ